MSGFDLNAPATLRWRRKDVPHERHLVSIREAVRIAMKELTRSEFFSAHVTSADEVYSGDQIAEIFLTGTLGHWRYAKF